MKLSKNFSDKEFRCPCKGKGCDKDVFPNGHLVTLLQYLRDEISQPIYITTGGGIRCRVYNNRIGGYVDSPHLNGKAADIYTKSLDYVKLAQFAKAIGFSRIGLYPNSFCKLFGGFIHVDIIEPYPSESWIRDENGKYFYYHSLELALKGLEKGKMPPDA